MKRPHFKIIGFKANNGVDLNYEVVEWNISVENDSITIIKKNRKNYIYTVYEEYSSSQFINLYEWEKMFLIGGDIQYMNLLVFNEVLSVRSISIKVMHARMEKTCHYCSGDDLFKDCQKNQKCI